jgi:CheY-like chemotaxis protein
MADRARATVLVVDDNVAKRYVISRWLRQAGFEVAEAETGAETLRLAGAADDARPASVVPPDLIILDIGCRTHERLLRSAAPQVAGGHGAASRCCTCRRTSRRARTRGGLEGGADG